MASKRFVKFTEEQIASFTEDQENANTKKKTVSDLKLFNEFLNSEEEERNIENIPAAELQQLAKKFVLGLRKKSGEEYEPSSLRGFLQSVDRVMESMVFRNKFSWCRCIHQLLKLFIHSTYILRNLYSFIA